MADFKIQDFGRTKLRWGTAETISEETDLMAPFSFFVPKW